jgi:hypothetical protein
LLYGTAIPIGEAHVSLANRYRATGDPLALMAWGMLRPIYCGLCACIRWLA